VVTRDQLRWFGLRWLGKLLLAFAPLAGFLFLILGPSRTDTGFAMFLVIVALGMALGAILMVYAQKKGPVHR
jgi:FtsH-binding integral membrane protein